MTTPKDKTRGLGIELGNPAHFGRFALRFLSVASTIGGRSQLTGGAVDSRYVLTKNPASPAA
jgi:hypothetical protein